jgi:hypothetical protein
MIEWKYKKIFVDFPYEPNAGKMFSVEIVFLKMIST